MFVGNISKKKSRNFLLPFEIDMPMLSLIHLKKTVRMNKAVRTGKSTRTTTTTFIDESHTT
jgi:hypothetical protein